MILESPSRERSCALHAFLSYLEHETRPVDAALHTGTPGPAPHPSDEPSLRPIQDEVAQTNLASDIRLPPSPSPPDRNGNVIHESRVAYFVKAGIEIAHSAPGVFRAFRGQF